ncbi:MAG: HD domain-containing protein [Clostridia bacterium]|nr:HD domain-containing protein [Clostridia bacterium]
MLIISTIVPAIGFILIFFYRYYSINLESEKALFDQEVGFFETELKNQFSNYEALLKSSSFLLENLTTRNIDEDSEFIKDYLEEIKKNDEIEEYYYITKKSTYTNAAKNAFLADKVQRFESFSLNDDFWVKKIGNLNDQLLYFGYKNSADEIIVFSMNQEYIFTNLKGYMNPNVDFKVSFNQIQLYESNEIINEITESQNSIFYKNKSYYLWRTKTSEINEYKYTLVMNISREISFVKSNLLSAGIVILMYLLLLGFILLKLSNHLILPINNLINYVSQVAKEKEIDQTPNKNNELVEVYELFDEMIQTSYQNIESIQDQSEIILEKNKIMEDLNQQLALSSEMIESSTMELKIFEKQSKTLVDNIKDLMWVIDTKGRIEYINSIVEDKLSYTPSELIGVKLENILKEDSYNEDALQDMFYEDYDDMDLIFIKKNNESEEIFATSTKRIFSNGKLVKIQGVSRDITEERYIEKQMIQKNMISSTLNEISEILTRPEKLEVLLNHIVIRIERLLNPLICTIRLIDDKGRLQLVAGIGEFYSLVQEKFLDIDKDISGRAIKESKIIIITDKNKDYFHNYDEVYSIVDQSQELIFLPLEYNDTTIGVMSIGLREHIADAQLKILKVFTTQASAAIEKARMYEELENNYLNIIKALASTVEAKDAYTEDHSIRVSKYSRMIAEELGMSDDEVGYIDIAGLLHDIGKIGVSDLTLTKEGKLSEEEFREIMKHPLNGGRIVSEMKLHEHIIEGVLLHHKRFDLKGYPDIYIESLPISARIIGVADAFDAMTTNRSYQKARNFNEALEELKKYAGTQFCPEIVQVMERVVEKLS